jgi:hypothetical protein
MKTPLIISFTFCFFFSHAAFLGNSYFESDSLKWQVAKKEKYQISYPDTMILEKESTGVDLMISTKITSESDLFQENISVTFQDLGAEIGLSDIMAMIEGEIRNEIQQGEIIENYDVILGGRTARRIRFTNVVNGMLLTWVQHYLVDGHFFYVITYTGEEDVYFRSIKNVQEIISTFLIN